MSRGTGRSADARVVAGPEESWYLGAVFTPGTKVGRRRGDPATFVRVAEVAQVTTIRVPSGRLIVDSPWPEDGDPELGTPVGRELAERIPAGAYRVEAAWTVAPFAYRDEHFDGRGVAAVRLCVADAPVVGWEMALGTGEDIAAIRPGDRLGFDSETNLGCLADAGAWPALTAPFREFWQASRPRPPGGRRTERLRDGWFERASDEEDGADLVTFSAEAGTTVWLGRTETGSVASVAVAVPGDHDPAAGNPLS